MRGLAKYDTDRAREAIELGLLNHPKLEGELCRLLVTVAPESAAEILIGTAVDSERDSLTDAVGRSLRRLEESATVVAISKRLAGTEVESKIACRISGWLPYPEIAKALDELVDGKSTIGVRKSALQALYRHREEVAVQGLYSEFGSVRCEARRWAFFVAILETVDPHLLSDRDDSLWLGHILTNDMAYAFEHYAGDVLRKRKTGEVAGADWSFRAKRPQLTQFPCLYDRRSVSDILPMSVPSYPKRPRRSALSIELPQSSFPTPRSALLAGHRTAPPPFPVLNAETRGSSSRPIGSNGPPRQGPCPGVARPPKRGLPPESP